MCQPLPLEIGKSICLKRRKIFLLQNPQNSNKNTRMILANIKCQRSNIKWDPQSVSNKKPMPTALSIQNKQSLFSFENTNLKNRIKKTQQNRTYMKLVWSPESASKAYIDTVKSFEYYESGVAELVSAMVAGWNAKFIAETWSRGGVITTSIGLGVASRHAKGRHVCIVPDEVSKSEYTKAMNKVGMSPEVIIGEPEDVMERLTGIDFLVVDCRIPEYSRMLRVAKLSVLGAVLVCKNANFRGFCSWRNVVEIGGGGRRVVRSVYRPVGNGLDIAHVAVENSDSGKWERRWVKHVDRESGEMHFFRK